jgi:hypothetical protein
MHGMAYVLLFTNRAAHAGHAVSSLAQWLQALHAAPWQHGRAWLSLVLQQLWLVMRDGRCP